MAYTVKKDEDWHAAEEDWRQIRNGKRSGNTVKIATTFVEYNGRGVRGQCARNGFAKKKHHHWGEGNKRKLPLDRGHSTPGGKEKGRKGKECDVDRTGGASDG